RLRIVCMKPVSVIAPERGNRCVIWVVSDQRGCQINAEAVSAQIQPELHYIFELLAHCYAGGIRSWKLPRSIRSSVAIIECGLKREEIGQIPFGVIALAGKRLAAGNVFIGRRPDIPVRVAIGLLARSRLLEPGTQDRSMTGDQVETDVHPALVCFGAEIFCVVVGTVAWSDLIKISHVITGVTKR